MKQRRHNEWFRTVSLGGRKSCPTCHEKLNGREIWSWGEYHNAKWRTVKHFCAGCFATEVKGLLLQHAGSCGCAIELCGRGIGLPAWLTLHEVPSPVAVLFGHETLVST